MSLQITFKSFIDLLISNQRLLKSVIGHSNISYA